MENWDFERCKCNDFVLSLLLIRLALNPLLDLNSLWLEKPPAFPSCLRSFSHIPFSF